METLCQRLGGSKGVSGELEVGEQLLELVGDAVVLAPVEAGVIPIRVDVVSDLGRHEEGLDQTVHVAGRPLVLQADVGRGPQIRLKRLNPLVDSLDLDALPGLGARDWG